MKKGPQLPFDAAAAAAAAMMIKRQKAKFSKSQVRSLKVIRESFEKRAAVRLSKRLDEAFDDHPSRDYFECSIRTIELLLTKAKSLTKRGNTEMGESYGSRLNTNLLLKTLLGICNSRTKIY